MSLAPLANLAVMTGAPLAAAPSGWSMPWWQAVVLGVVEGITEYLPISSTGHLILASSLMGLSDPARPDIKHAVDAFNIVIQGGAILAVLGLYRSRVAQMLKGLLGRDPAGLRLLTNLFIAFLPAAALGFLLDDWIEARLFHAGPVLAALAAGGVFMIALEQWRRGRFGTRRSQLFAHHLRERDLDELTPLDALLIGLMQCVAMWPGTSRSMMTITAGIMRGLRPGQAAEFSFLLGLPTLGGACVYTLAKNLKASADAGTPNLFETIGWSPCIVGLLAATISAALAVRWLVGFLNRHGLTPFGWYRLALCAVLGALIAAEVVSI